MSIIYEDYIINNTVNKKSIVHIGDRLYKNVRDFLQRNFESNNKKQFYQCVDWLRNWCYETNEIAKYDKFTHLNSFTHPPRTFYVWECKNIGYFIIFVFKLKNKIHVLIDDLLDRDPSISSIALTKTKKSNKHSTRRNHNNCSNRNNRYSLLECIENKSYTYNRTLYERIMKDIAKIVKRHIEIND